MVRKALFLLSLLAVATLLAAPIWAAEEKEPKGLHRIDGAAALVQ